MYKGWIAKLLVLLKGNGRKWPVAYHLDTR